MENKHTYQFVEKLIGRLEEYKDSHLIEHDSEECLHCQENEDDWCNCRDCSICVWDKAVEIVNQLAEEYNNGWINADVESPTENGKYIVYYRKWTDGNYLPKFDETEIRILRYRNNDWVFPTYGDTEAEKDIHREVLAWQPLPAPYKPKGE